MEAVREPEGRRSRHRQLHHRQQLPARAGLRRHAPEDARGFDELWIIDLGGDNLGARKTPNVFNIQTPVAIAIGLRHGPPQPETPAKVHYARVDADSREAKLEAIAKIGSLAELPWQDGFSDWMKPLLPEGEGDYYDWPLLTDVFPWQHSGVEYKRSWPISESREVLESRWEALVSAAPQARPALFRETGDRRVSNAYKPMDGEGARLLPISSLKSGTPPEEIVRVSFRSFDRQWAIADGRTCSRPRPPLWLVRGQDQVFLTSLLTGLLGVGPVAMVAPYVLDRHHFRGSFGGKDVIPLWRDAAASEPNVTAGLLDRLSAAFGRKVAVEDLFAYAYAVLATPRYVERFSEELTVPGPRLPLTRDAALFDAAAALGRELIHLHTYGERFVPKGGKAGQVSQGRARLTVAIPDTPEGYPEDFEFDPAAQTLRVGAGGCG